MINASDRVDEFVYKNRINKFNDYTIIFLKQYSRDKSVYDKKIIKYRILCKKANLDNSFYKKYKDEYKYFNGTEFFGKNGDFPNKDFLA